MWFQLCTVSPTRSPPPEDFVTFFKSFSLHIIHMDQKYMIISKIKKWSSLGKYLQRRRPLKYFFSRCEPEIRDTLAFLSTLSYAKSSSVCLEILQGFLLSIHCTHSECLQPRPSHYFWSNTETWSPSGGRHGHFEEGSSRPCLVLYFLLPLKALPETVGCLYSVPKRQ